MHVEVIEKVDPLELGHDTEERKKVTKALGSRPLASVIL